ncbi:uncharacterized protein LOC141850780 [Brevipalpus obovatus]|uniref:uncharacterized protein LOC141850780 n=1 Tax=Brevipalpus obovatus TaxID=246614 RepID=UPI003D9E63DE
MDTDPSEMPQTKSSPNDKSSHESSSDEKVVELGKIDEIHRAATLGNVRYIQQLIDQKQLVFCRDQMGSTPLHKAVIYGQKEIIDYLVNGFPSVIHARDNRGRTPLHYAAVLPESSEVYQYLVEKGGDEKASDMFGKKAEDYLKYQEGMSVQILRESAIVSHPTGQRRSRRSASRIIDPQNWSKIHSSRSLMHRSNIRELIRQGNIATLEEIVIQGYGDRLIGETATTPMVQEFLRRVPDLIEQINELHKAVQRGNLEEVRALLDRKGMVLVRDQIGCTPLHKAVMYGQYEIANFLSTSYPATLDTRDHDGRTALHYAAVLSDDKMLYNALVKNGASTSLMDYRGNTAEHYLRFSDEINLQQLMKRSHKLNANYAINTANRIKSRSPSRKRDISPGNQKADQRASRNEATPTVDQSLDTFNDGSSNDSSGDRPLLLMGETNLRSKPANVLTHTSPIKIPRIEVTSANLKKWVEEQDLISLEEAVLEGHGEQVKSKVEQLPEIQDSTQIRTYVKETIPKIMEKIRSIHAAVSCGDLQGLQDQLDKKDYALSKDHLGMAPLHKAVILGHLDVVQFILNRFPETVNARDREGRTALHYAAATTHKNGQKIYKILQRSGADGRARDLAGRSAEYYRVHLLPLPAELSRHASKRKFPDANVLSPTMPHRRIMLPGIKDKIISSLNDSDINGLLDLTMEGFGDSLVGRTCWGEEGRKFLKNLPHLLDCIRTLHTSIFNGELNHVKKLLQYDSNLLRAKDETGLMAIHLAVSREQTEIVQYIIKNYPFTLQHRDHYGRTALHIAAQNKSTELYKMLVDAGADPRCLDQRGRTPEQYLKLQSANDGDGLRPINSLIPPGSRSESRVNGQAARSKSNASSRTSSPEKKKKSEKKKSESESEAKSEDKKSTESDANNNSKSEPEDLSQKEDQKDQSESIQEKTNDNIINEKSDEAINESEGEKNGKSSKKEPSLARKLLKKLTSSDKTEETDGKSKNGQQKSVEDESETSKSEEGSSKSDVKTLEPKEEEPKKSIDAKDPEKMEDKKESIESESPEKSEGPEEPSEPTKIKADEPDQTSDDSKSENPKEDGKEKAVDEETRLQNSNSSEQKESKDEPEKGNINRKGSTDKGSEGNSDETNGKSVKPNGLVDTPKGSDSQTKSDETIKILDDTSKDEVQKQSETTGPQDDSQAKSNQSFDVADGKTASSDTRSEPDIKQEPEPQPKSSAEPDTEREPETQPEPEPSSGNEFKVEEPKKEDENESKSEENRVINGSDKGLQKEDTENSRGEKQVTKSTQLKKQESRKKLSSITSTSIDCSSSKESKANGPSKPPRRKPSLTSGRQEVSPEKRTSPRKRSMPVIPSSKLVAKNGINKSGIDEKTKTLRKRSSEIISTITTSTTKMKSTSMEEQAKTIALSVVEDSIKAVISKKNDEDGRDVNIKNSQNDENNNNETISSETIPADSKEVVKRNNKKDKNSPPKGVNKTVRKLKNSSRQDSKESNEIEAYIEQREAIENKRDHSENLLAIIDPVGLKEQKNRQEAKARGEVPESDAKIEPEKPSELNGESNEDSSNNIETNEDFSKNTESKSDATDREPLEITDSDPKIGENLNPSELKSNDDVEKFEPDKRPTSPRPDCSTASTGMSDDRLSELIDRWLEDGDLLRLEHVVIAGQGERLIGRTSSNESVQDFLNLVPVYMSKIGKVHETVVKGNLNEVRQVLTRKRFALSRDHVGASPLHLAVLHEHPDILAYIISKFPETLDGPDNEGRTPLHYAAVMATKSRHSYDVLLNAGANTNLADKLSNTAQHYLEHPGELTIGDLLSNYRKTSDSGEPPKTPENVDVWKRPPTADIESRLTPSPSDSQTGGHGDSGEDGTQNGGPNRHEVNADVHVDGKVQDLDKFGVKQVDDEEVKKEVETMSVEFKEVLREEKGRLKETIRRIMGKVPNNGTVESLNISDSEASGSDKKSTGDESKMNEYELCQVKDEHGQTILHLLAGKAQRKPILHQMLASVEYLIPERDAKYRTIRDVAVDAGLKSNIQVIDNYILGAFVRRNVGFAQRLSHEGFDLLNVVDESGNDITSVLRRNNISSMIKVLQDINYFQKLRDELHTFVKNEYLQGVTELVDTDSTVVTAKNSRGRTALHVAILFGNFDIISTLINANREAVKIPDNMGRSPLHYAMAFKQIENIGRILIKAGANRSVRDVRMRTPSYYFVYPEEIRVLKSEEKNASA